MLQYLFSLFTSYHVAQLDSNADGEGDACEPEVNPEAFVVEIGSDPVVLGESSSVCGGGGDPSVSFGDSAGYVSGKKSAKNATVHQINSRKTHSPFPSFLLVL